MQFAKLYSSILAAISIVTITNGFVPQSNRGCYRHRRSLNVNTLAANGEEGSDTDRNCGNVNSNLDTNTDVNKDNITGASETNSESLSTFSRRKYVRTIFDCALFTVGAFAGTKQASANLVQFPVTNDLMNTYHIMRAGESILDHEDIISTNPLFL